MIGLAAIIGLQLWWLSGWVIVPVFIAIGVAGSVIQGFVRRSRRVPTAEDVKGGELIGQWGAASFVVGVAAYVAFYLLLR